MKRLASFFLAASLAAILGCSSSTTPEPVFTYTVSGTIENPSSIELPTHIRAVCVWSNGSASDSLPPTFGSATIDSARRTFAFTFNGKPPILTATSTDNSKWIELGYGYILLLGDRSEGGALRNYGLFSGPILGAVDTTAVLFYRSNTQLHSMTYLNGFSQGYNVIEAIDPRGDTSLYARDTNIVLGRNTGLVLRVDTNAGRFHFPRLFGVTAQVN